MAAARYLIAAVSHGKISGARHASFLSRRLAAVSDLERIVQRDEGKRNSSLIARPAGELAAIAQELLRAQKVTILTGFPCVQNVIPTETDGPSGTAAICRALKQSNPGVEIVVATDECNRQVVEACVSSVLPVEDSPKWRLEIFPPESKWSEAHQTKLESLALWSDHIVALERVSSGVGGCARTMSGRIMDQSLVAPLDQLFSAKFRAKYSGYKTTCVGDGGNELGMGAVADLVRTHIEKGELIVSAESADYLFAVSVSNWGGYAIAGALGVLRQDDILDLVPRDEDETIAIQACVDAGAHDGVKMVQALSVDGLDLVVHLAILQELREVIKGVKQEENDL